MDNILSTARCQDRVYGIIIRPTMPSPPSTPLRKGWPLIPELHAHWPVVARPVFAVRAVVHHLGFVLGVVHGPRAGYTSQPRGPVETGREQDVVEEQVLIWHQRRDEVIEDGAEPLRRRQVVLSMTEEPLRLERGANKDIRYAVREEVLLEVIHAWSVVQVPQDNEVGPRVIGKDPIQVLPHPCAFRRVAPAILERANDILVARRRVVPPPRPGWVLPAAR